METDRMVCIEVWAGKGQGLTVHHRSGSVAVQSDVDVWDACSIVETWTSYILPVVTPPELTFILSWEGTLSWVPLSHHFVSSHSACCGTGTCQKGVSWKKHFPKGKKVKDFVCFPTILNFWIFGKMNIYSVMSTIINKYCSRKQYFLPAPPQFSQTYFTYLCVCQNRQGEQ